MTTSYQHSNSFENELDQVLNTQDDDYEEEMLFGASDQPMTLMTKDGMIVDCSESSKIEAAETTNEFFYFSSKGTEVEGEKVSQSLDDELFLI